jgi:CheY-like chemotaxis protein
MEAALTTLRCLVVGPIPGVREQIMTILSHSAFEFVEADDGIAALQQSCEFGIDLVVTDNDLPRLCGGELVELVQRGIFGAKPPPVIVCAGFEEYQTFAIHSEIKGGVVVVGKPICPEEFCWAVGAAFHEAHVARARERGPIRMLQRPSTRYI